MSLQVTITLDSGSIPDLKPDGIGAINVGYFKPHFRIYGDGDEILEITPSEIPSNMRFIEVLHQDLKGNSIGGPEATAGLEKYLLNLGDHYNTSVKFKKDAYNFIFRFKAGLFRPSMVKDRFFKKINSENRTDFGQIAHDISVLLTLEKGETLAFRNDSGILYSKTNLSDACTRLDIQILADNSTATMFYDKCLINEDGFRWIPNQGDPPPAGGGPWEPPF